MLNGWIEPSQAPASPLPGNLQVGQLGVGLDSLLPHHVYSEGATLVETPSLKNTPTRKLHTSSSLTQPPSGWESGAFLNSSLPPPLHELVGGRDKLRKTHSSGLSVLVGFGGVCVRVCGGGRGGELVRKKKLQKTIFPPPSTFFPHFIGLGSYFKRVGKGPTPTSVEPGGGATAGEGS